MQKTLSLCILLASLLNVSLADNKPNNSVVLDKINHIYWQDNLSSQKSSEDYDDAIAYCDRLVLNGLEEWRLPTFQELYSIVDYTRYKPAIHPSFQYTNEGTYWSATTFVGNQSRAWTINFQNGMTYYSYKTTNHTVRCVKDIPQTKKKKGAK